MPLRADPQANQLYAVEEEFNGWWNMVRSPREALLDLITDVCNHYEVEPPRLVISRKKVRHGGDYSDNVITLYSGGDNPGVLMHELAHHLTDEWYPEAENHGPEFCAIYMELLDKWAILPKEAFRCISREYGIRIKRGCPSSSGS